MFKSYSQDILIILDANAAHQQATALKRLLSFVISSLDTIIPEERDIEVKQADLKKHLTITEVEGKPR